MIAPVAFLLAAHALVASAEVVRQTTELGGIRAEVSADGVHEVGQTIACTLRLSGPDRATAALGAPEALGEFDVLAISPPRTEGDAIVFDLALSTFAAGKSRPAPIEIRWTHDGAEQTGSVEFPEFAIASLLSPDENGQVDPTKFRDIAGAIEIPAPFAWWPWAAGGVALVAVAAAAWWVFRRRPAVPPEPDEWALGELARLERAALPERGAFGLYYDELTAIVRRYVSLRYAIPAEQQTSRELLAATRAHDEFPHDESERVQTLLRLADLVKFAKAEPTRAECDANLAEARGFVERTRPQRGEEAKP